MFILIVGDSRDKQKDHAQVDVHITATSQIEPQNETEPISCPDELAVLRSMYEDLQREHAQLKEGMTSLQKPTGPKHWP
jgi:hypothetical protein